MNRRGLLGFVGPGTAGVVSGCVGTDDEGNENLGIVAQLDHSANVSNAGLDLEPTRVVFFGNPEAGTPLMQESQRAGLDLPQRMLVREEDDEVRIAYNDPEYTAARHGIEGQDELLENVTGVLEALATGET